MAYLFAGLIALVFALAIGRWLASARPAVVARAVRWALGILVGIAVVFIIWAGRYQFLAMVLPFLLPAFLRWRSLARWRRNMRGPTPGQTSAINTAFLRMVLHHDSGALEGEVVAGAYAGRRLNDLALDDLMRLHGECGADEPSRRILEAYLDRAHGAAWHQAAGRQQSSADSRSAGRQAMSREEAYAILGLRPEAGEDAVKEAHRRLMTKLHPDRGGSDHLAALINQARDLLLGR